MCLHLQCRNLVADAAALAVVEWEVAQAMRGHVRRAGLAVQPPIRVELERVGSPDFGVALKDEHGQLQVGAGRDEQGLEAVATRKVVILDRDSQIELQC